MNNEKQVNRRTLVGRVSSNKMDKTITVIVNRKIPHPRYKKYVKRRTKIKAHDPENRCQEGDTVKIIETRPLSKTKSWELVDVLETAV